MAASGSSARRTPAQQAGDAAEGIVAAALAAGGWEILARHVRVGRAEIDLVAIDRRAPPALVAVEVRWRSERTFGLPEETVDARKIGRLWSALGALLARGALPDGRPLPRLPARLDLVVVEPGTAGGPPRLRHHPALGGAGAGGSLW